ncbi:LOW QUALITY PROTEIN: uncharacterized protein LOC131850081 [Achroia grisella]|uniref:LOW QUALITY PROTEIN: uncharacterized protein LOC131850081 n=1 Tax=Achroia grisella TaxID=688607 RepID=UPI0027D22C86|nr:LOW QUALITY PROTEIN: uncharacterized protein LOC131850081 [Achroia grisella]
MTGVSETNLGERQRQLNAQVSAAKLNNVDFEEIVAKEEISDRDKLFKIDLASEQQNVEYIVNILKCGDSLYITRALKCVWIFDDKYSNIINPENLQQNIFPFMSFKLKKKFLTTIATNLLCKKRATSFYTYCMDTKYIHIALKFFIITTDDFKLEAIQHKSTPFHVNVCEQEDKYMKDFIGNSFELAYAYLESVDDFHRERILYMLRYLYTISNEEFLDLLEKYDSGRNRICCYGLRISKSIMQKHKDRVLTNIKIYINTVNKKVLAKYSNEDNARSYLKSFLPETAEEFWKINYCKVYKFILELIPKERRFETIKGFFKEKYNEEFETKKKFYELYYYKLMTPTEQEAWALHQLNNNKELLGSENEYLWYRFINFKISFSEIKKYVMITTNADKRIRIVNVLIESARNQHDLIILLSYFYNRHVNELSKIKESFLTDIIEKHNIFEFEDECWNAFNKILYSLNIYNKTIINNCSTLLYATTLIYHILKKKDLPDALQQYLNCEMQWYWIEGHIKSLYTKLNLSQQHTVYQYLLHWYTIKLQSMDAEADDKKVSKDVRRYIDMILSILIFHKKTKEQCPDVVIKFVNLDWDRYKNHTMFYKKQDKFTNDDVLVHQLKKDPRVVADRCDEIKKEILEGNYKYTIKRFLRKLKIYFSDDLVKIYLNLFLDILKSTDPDKLYMFTVHTVVYGIIQLADEQTLNDLMLKYTPTEPKIDYSKVDLLLLNTQSAICRFACYSRPPVPLSNIRMYIKGDYVRFCLPMFNYYASNLPLSQCMKFIESLLDAPVSIHKHGLRLAFLCFSTEQLKTLIVHVWKTTKNISVRFILYNALFNQIVNSDETKQMQLFPVLKSCFLELKEDDQKYLIDNIYIIYIHLLTYNRLPHTFLGEYVECAWQAVNNLSIDKTINIERKENVIENIINEIHLLKADFVNSIIKKHLNDMLVEGGIMTKYTDSLHSLHTKIWKLSASYIIFFADQQLDENVKLAEFIIKKCINLWSFVNDDIYTIRQFCCQYLNFLIENRYDNKNYEDAVPIFESISKILQDSLPVFETYLAIWDLQLTIADRMVVEAGKLKYNTTETAEDKVLVIKETVLQFVNRVGDIIKDRVLSHTHFSCFNNKIEYRIISTVESIKNSLDINYETQMEVADLRVIISKGLSEYTMFETYLLAMYILPTTSSRYWSDDYEDVINKIKESNNLQLKSYLYQKFVNSDYKRRKFIM